MARELTIGAAARRTGLSVKTIRFYESAGIVPPPARTATGYRVYTATDLRRLRLARRARLLGLGLREVRTLVAEAFAADCADFGDNLVQRIAGQRAAIVRRIAELRGLLAQLDALEQRARRAACVAVKGERVLSCRHCPLIDDDDAAMEEEIITMDANDRVTTVEVLDVLSCNLAARPAQAPDIFAVAQLVRSMQRDAEGLTVEFDPRATDMVAAFVDAEQRCCTEIGWDLQRKHGRLRITAAAEQLDMLTQLFSMR